MNEPVNVRLLTYAEVEKNAYPAPAFSNGFEWDCWQSRWCETCNHDEDLGVMGDTGVVSCPLAGVVLIHNVTPRELVEVSLGGLENRYRCLGYEVRDGELDARDGVPKI